MRTSELHYELPPELIARYPAERRDAARLLVVGANEPHRRVRDLVELIPPGALLVVNDTRVLAARLRGNKPTGGKVEVLLVEPVSSCADSHGEGCTSSDWRALLRSNKPLRVGAKVVFPCAELTILSSRDEHGMATVRCDGDLQGLWELGEMPLPPYLGRAAEPLDRERYQTVFAAREGAVAAPTAGLHFTPELLEKLRENGVALAQVTLHVGLGTFKPVKADDLDEHPMHAEQYEVSAACADAIRAARERGAPVVAVGTTVVRALESAADEGGIVTPRREHTRLLIQPGYRFRVVDRLLTNFHLPGSTLLALVYAFAGTETVRAAYQQAITDGYRFYSYGDAMLLTGKNSLRSAARGYAK